jgi:ribonuclease-3
MTQREPEINNDDIIKVDDNLIFNPYNPFNVEITLSDVQCILQKYGIPPIVNNLELYKRAFVHTSYLKRSNLENQLQNIIIVDKPQNCLPLKSKSNERLEFLGDGVLELIAKYYLYRRFPKEEPGFMTDKKIAIVKNESIGKIAYEMQLHKWLIISKHAEEKKTRCNLKKLGCLFESFLGALFLDFNKIDILDEEGWFHSLFKMGPGIQMAQLFIENIFDNHIDWIELIQNDDNYKNILQVIIQKRYKITPSYIELNHNNDTGYLMGVYISIGKNLYSYEDIIENETINIDKFNSFIEIDNYITNNNGKIVLFLGKGIHKIKRKSEQMGCYNVLQILNKWSI